MMAYPEYKATGLHWLPQIPKHWDWLFLSQISEEQKIKNIAAKEKNVLSLSYGNIIRKKNLNGGLTPQDWATYQIVFPGNIILRLTDLQNDHTSLRTGLVKEQGIITSAYTCVKTSHNSAFLHYLLHAYDIQKVFYGFGGGVRQSIGYKALRNLCFPIPAPDEQAQIVRYLDAMTAKINKLIRAKKKQIALLQEQKQAIINQAVTQGLDPNVEMKDSGIDWLGKIPKHWKIRPLKFYANSNQKSLSGTMDENFSFRYLEISSVGFGFIKKEPETFFFKAAPSRARRIVQQGDTIISTVRTYLRSMCFIDESIADCIVSTGFSVLTPKKEVLPVLLSYALNTDYFVNEVIRNSIGISYPAISDSKLLSLKLALPDTLEEQKEIFRHIKQKTSDIDQEIEQLGKTINKINEYKNSLVDKY